MRFEYNSNLVFEERVKLVAKEIVDKYPFISETDAIKIASLSTPIDDRHTKDDEFNRFYHILRTLDLSNKYYLIVFTDFLTLFQHGLNEYNDVMQEIINYTMGYSSEFPELA